MTRFSRTGQEKTTDLESVHLSTEKRVITVCNPLFTMYGWNQLVRFPSQNVGQTFLCSIYDSTPLFELAERKERDN